MDENPDPTKPEAEEPTPEVARLLKLIELQTAAIRSRGEQGGRGSVLPKAFRGVSFRYGSLILIVVFAFGSVAVMEWLVSQIPRPAHSSAAVPPSLSTPGAKTGNPSPVPQEKPDSRR